MAQHPSLEIRRKKERKERHWKWDVNEMVYRCVIDVYLDTKYSHWQGQLEEHACLIPGSWNWSGDMKIKTRFCK
jgi:hypothetical protein